MRHYPASYLDVPTRLDPTGPPASVEELEQALSVRREFLLPGEQEPYMVDIVRAMRLLEGCERYVEVGTYDKGCLAYLSGVLGESATLIDVDIEARPEQTQRLKSKLKRGQRLVTAIGDSTSDETLAQVKDGLPQGLADAVFIDGNHVASYVWADYALYGDLVAPGGIMLFHDVLWRGTDTIYGAADAMQWIDRAEPVYVVCANDPVHRFFPHFVKEEQVWGAVGIVLR